MDDAKNQVRVVLPAADVVGVLDRDVEMTGMTAQADESQSKEKPESDEKAGTAVASQDQSAVVLQAPIAADGALVLESEIGTAAVDSALPDVKGSRADVEDKSAVGSDGGRRMERRRDESGSESPKAEKEEIVSEPKPKDRVDNMDVENEPLQQQALAASLIRMSEKEFEGEGLGEEQFGSVRSPGSNTSPLSSKALFESSGLLSLGSVEFAGSLRVHAFYVIHCMYTQYSGSIACACN